MSKTMKKVSALLLAILMIVTYMPMMQETAYAAKKAKKPAKVKISSAKASGKKITVKWKKAKNAKKYIVSVKDMSTKLTSSKSVGKKKSFSFTGSWNNKYQIKVRGVNGKKKGSWSKAKTVTIGQDPNTVSKQDYEDALNKAAESEKAAKDLADKLKAAQDALEIAKAVADSNISAVDASEDAIAAAKEALEELKAAKEAWDELGDDEKAAVRDIDPDLADALDGITDQTIQDAEDAIADAEEAINNALKEVLELDSWNPEVKKAINDMIVANKGKDDKYVVFDFDNTCSIFDVEEQLAIYQLQTMAFDESVDREKLEQMLKTGLNPEYFTEPAPASGDYCSNPNAT